MSRAPNQPNQLTEAEVLSVIDRPIAMQHLATVLGVSGATISNSAVGFKVGMTFGECIRAINDYRRSRVSGHSGELSEERAKLAAIQTERIEMELAERRGELVPVGVLMKTLSAGIAASVQHLEAVPGRVRMRDPSLTAAQSLIIEDEIARARNSISETRLDLE